MDTRGKFDLTKSFEKSSGYTPLMFAAYVNNWKACEILIKFLLRDEEFFNVSDKSINLVPTIGEIS